MLVDWKHSASDYSNIIWTDQIQSIQVVNTISDWMCCPSQCEAKTQNVCIDVTETKCEVGI